MKPAMFFVIAMSLISAIMYFSFTYISAWTLLFNIVVLPLIAVRFFKFVDVQSTVVDTEHSGISSSFHHDSNVDETDKLNCDSVAITLDGSLDTYENYQF